MILCVGLTPTVQRTLRFVAPLQIGEVNRAAEAVVTASGKAMNVAKVITALGGTARLVQPLGGDGGRTLTREMAELHMDVHTILVNTPTRTCTTVLVDNGPTTELVEEAQPITDAELASTVLAVERHLPFADALALSGSLIAGVNADFYADLVAKANAVNVPVVLDAQKEPLRFALASRPFLVKPNLEEATRTLSLPRTGDTLVDARAAIHDLRAAGAVNALVTFGKAGLLLGTGDGAYYYITPPTVDVVNPIGSGDSLAAGLCYALAEQKATLPDAAVFATACATANCLTLTSGTVRRMDVDRLLPDVQITRMD